MFILGLISISRPGVAFALILSMFGIEQFLHTQSSFFVLNGQAVNISIGAVVAVATGCSLLRSSAAINRPNLVQVLSIMLFAYAFFSYFWTPSQSEFKSRWISSIPYLGLFLVLGPMLTQEKHAIRDGLRWTMFLGVPLVCLAAFYCEWGKRGMILASPIKEGNKFVAETLPLALASFASYVGIITLAAHLKIPLRTLFRFAVLGVAIYIAFMTQSRGQVVALILVSAAVYSIEHRIGSIKGVLFTLAGLTALALIVYVVAQQMDLARWRSDRVENGLFGRQEMWWELLQQWFETGDMRILFGLGAASSFNYIGFYPHNLPIEILAELGFIGTGLFVVIVWVSVVNSLKLLRRLDDFPDDRGEILVLLGLLTVSLALSLKEGSLYSWPVLFFFAICLNQKEVATRKSLSRRQSIAQYFWVPARQTPVRVPMPR